MSKERLVVIGNGMAGARFVDDLLGREGASRFDVVMFGDEPCGNYNRILLSSVLSRSHKPDDIFINPMSWYASRGITLHAGKRVEKIDLHHRMVTAAGGQSERYDTLIIATGSSPVIPPLANVRDEHGVFKQGVFVFRTLDDCERIMRCAETARRAVVIGGGLLGLEAARGLLNWGLETHVVHLMPHLMETQLDTGAGDVLRRQFEQMGLLTHLATRTTAVLGNGHVKGLEFADGAPLECDLVVIAAGIRPNAKLAADAGLKVNRGIVVGDDLGCSGWRHAGTWRLCRRRVRRAPWPRVRVGCTALGADSPARGSAQRPQSRRGLSRVVRVNQAQGDGRRSCGDGRQGAGRRRRRGCQL